MDVRDWVLLLTAIIQLYTALIINRREKKKKGTRKRRVGRRR
ncbi:hypothetical protein ABNC92_03820 [Paenibacillus larvae]